MVLVSEINSPLENSQFDLSAYLSQRQTLVEQALDQSLPLIYPEKIYESMRYSLLAGGKRLRPILCLATCELVGGTVEMAMATACALEMIHTMSLIHDDLPAMDNDDYRRGKLTNHKVYGEDIAILAGDGLLSYAFEFVATKTPNVPANQVLQVIARLGRAMGAAGLVGGQVVDLDSEGLTDVSEETLTFIHTHKTGALLEASVVCGAILAGAKETEIEGLSRYARNIGLAFQIVDDILDITATQEELGKTAGKDLTAKKVTYPSLWGIDESRRQAQQLIEAAKAELSNYGDKAIPLLAIADFITNRTH
ncbi:geranylgeranyl diphosphate synthase CrtE [Planktothrix agardhii]|jgi:geranylgeranyl diphosphate synthase type II|uniref:dimethylallyltranstransferase n=1 Tax=Planktothrix agardhii TaxID=1160 RepID=A0A1J1JF31_PLAAG|nr:farnesyl diphosphate synthase [Planktothrix agardhii]MCF3606228.1 polyprenyl synthetase family protein [Planktothrix agardhii 1033]BBD56106.1 geranylgeranyl pyrophosphate synthase [Planktothrix agardhii NIES-204]MBG0748939.1 polyprenyl synthetase family protein [Planktothrix agardhii KL2]MCB8750339.1 polyprenyl synthetase family protein [Planktothrix agardhii 1810]MCB8759106.1 polyprenyl synthetase family protein [Planktothrix agardhii 1813]